MGTALFLCIYSSSWSAVVWPLQAVYHPGSPVLKNWACNFHKKSFWMWQCRGVQPPPVIAAGLFCDAQSMHRSGLLSVPLWDWASLLDCSPWTKTLGLYVAFHHLSWAEHQINLHTAQNSHCVWRERFSFFLSSLSWILHRGCIAACLCASPAVMGSVPFWLLSSTAILTPSPHPLEFPGSPNSGRSGYVV